MIQLEDVTRIYRVGDERIQTRPPGFALAAVPAVGSGWGWGASVKPVAPLSSQRGLAC